MLIIGVLKRYHKEGKKSLLRVFCNQFPPMLCHVFYCLFLNLMKWNRLLVDFGGRSRRGKGKFIGVIEIN